jgi:hypothetical protein
MNCTLITFLLFNKIIQCFLIHILIKIITRYNKIEDEGAKNIGFSLGFA